MAESVIKKISEEVETPSSGITNVAVWKVGKIITLRLRGCTVNTGIIGTLPDGIRPIDTINSFIRVTESGNKYQAGILTILTNGTISVSTFVPNTTTVSGGPNGTVVGEIVYAIH